MGSNQTMSEGETTHLLKELIEVAKHPDLEQILINGIANITEVKDTFRNKAMELNGDAPAQDNTEAPPSIEDNTDYVALVKALIDPDISDKDVKPLLTKLMEGTLNEDQRHQVNIIMNCKDRRQQEEKKTEQIEEESIDFLNADLRSLVTKFLDPK